MNFYFKLLFGPSWENVSVIRHFVKSILSDQVVPESEASKIALVGSELMENASKNTKIGGASIEMVRDFKNSNIVFTIKNITTFVQIEKFKEIFKMVHDGDSKEAYKKMMLRSVKSEDISQLGLARIRYECNVDLSYTISEDFNSCIDENQDSVPAKDFSVLIVKAKIPANFKN